MNIIQGDRLQSLSVISCQKGDREFYTGSIRFYDLENLFYIVESDSQLEVQKRSQRKVTPSRVKKLIKYITNNPKTYILPSLTAEISSDFEFEFDGEDDPIGDLIFNFCEDEYLGLIDGQHRVSAILEIMRDEKYREIFIDHEISIDIYPYETLTESQQRFSDLNSKATKVSKNLTLLYDDSDGRVKFTKDYLKSKPVLHQRTEYENTSVSKNKLFALKDWHVITSKICDVLDKEDIPYLQQKKFITMYLDNLVMLFSDDWEVSDIADTKKNTIAATPLMFASLALLFGKIVDYIKSDKPEDYKFNLKDFETFLANHLTFFEFNTAKDSDVIINNAYHNGRLVTNAKVKKTLANIMFDFLFEEE